MAMLYSAVRAGLTEAERSDFGEVAGEHVEELGANRGLEKVEGCHVYESVINHACLADILVTAMRRPGDAPWVPAGPEGKRKVSGKLAENGGEIGGKWGVEWESGAYLDPSGDALRGFLLVSSWSKERERAAMSSWATLGEVCHFGLPMKLAVAVVGPMEFGRRRSPWCKGLLHPSNRSLRFKRRGKGWTTGFKETWQPAWREDHAEIDRRAWLQAMLEDDVLASHLFAVEVSVPPTHLRDRVRGLAETSLTGAEKTELPSARLEVCNDPIHPCPFISCCWSEPESSPEDGGYDPV